MEIKIPFSKIIHFYLLLQTLILSSAVTAVHLDVEVWGDGNALFAGYCRTPGIVGCDLGAITSTLKLPPGILPVESATGKLIFLADFQDLPGGDFKTKNPGFQSIQNALLPNELLSYRALGSLKYWNPALLVWENPAPDVQIRLFGGLEASADAIRDFTQCAGQLVCFSDVSFGIDGSTIFSSDGIHGNPELVIDITSASSVLHTHLSFFLENQNGEIGGAAGAYLIEIQVVSNARYFPSNSFLILFNAGLNDNEFATALLALTGETSVPQPLPPPPQVPASIPGDVDLDGDVDRMDVALILLAAQNNEPLRFDNIAFDVNGDGVINRDDAFLAKSLCTLRLCNIPLVAPNTALNMAAIFNEQTGVLNLNGVQVNNQHYRAQLQFQNSNIFVLNSVQPDIPRYASPAHFDPGSGIVEIPTVYTNGKYFKAILRNVGDAKFQLEHAEEINMQLD